MTTKYKVQNTKRLPLNFIQAICFKQVLTGQQKTEEVVWYIKNTSWNIANNYSMSSTTCRTQRTELIFCS